MHKKKKNKLLSKKKIIEMAEIKLAKQSELIVKKLFLGLKRSRNFGTFITQYAPITATDIEYYSKPSVLGVQYNTKVTTNTISIQKPKGVVNSRNALDSLYGRILTMAYVLNKKHVRKKLVPIVALDLYLQEELRDYNKKTYPNAYICGAIGGTISTALGIIIISIGLWTFFSLTAVFGFLIFLLMMFILLWILLIY